MPEDDTIFALSSGAPPAAIAIIRISGPQAFLAVMRLAGRVPKARHPSLAKLRDAGGLVIDEALLLTFPGPDSATGEDLAELHVHGGRAVVRTIEAELATMDGLRKAEAGEFTRRAFLQGRIDLNEAEGLSDLLAAETEHQRRAAVNMYGGMFSRAIENWRTELLRISALTEAELDFSDEDDVGEQNNKYISIACADLGDQIHQVLRMPSAEKLRDGLRVVLGGPPNSGKSTLLNALVGRDAAIVSDIAGTTRDVIEIPVAIDGTPLVICDTAGVREDHQDSIEEIGIQRAYGALAGADLILWLGAQGELGGQASQESEVAYPAVIEIEAMADLARHSAKSGESIKVSAYTGVGMAALTERIVSCAKLMLPPADSYAVNARQRKYLADAVSALRAASESVDWLIVAEYLRLARLALDALTGRAHTEDLLDNLFGTFCVGK